ncbi:MAG: hypothetical protein ABI678_08450 [Kofleriaceae bacterium]
MKTIGDALELLTAQHDDIQNLLAGIPDLEGERLAHALGELADKVATHLVAENDLRKTLQLADDGDDRALQRALTTIFALDLDAAEIRERIAEFTAMFREHAATQEQGVFIALAETINPDVLEQVGVRLSKWSERASVLAA